MSLHVTFLLQHVAVLQRRMNNYVRTVSPTFTQVGPKKEISQICVELPRAERISNLDMYLPEVRGIETLGDGLKDRVRILGRVGCYKPTEF